MTSNDTEKNLTVESLAGLAKTYDDLQRMRIALGNKGWAATEAKGRAVPRIYEKMTEQLKSMEESVVKTAMDALKGHIFWPWLKACKGLGPTMAMQLLGYIGDIGRFDTVSKLWKYCGLGVTEGHADRLTRGVKAGYNTRMKTLMYLIGTSFLKSRSPYRRIYDESKATYQSTRQDMRILLAFELPDMVEAKWKPILDALGDDAPAWREFSDMSLVSAWVSIVIRKARAKAYPVSEDAKKDDKAWKALLTAAIAAAKAKGMDEPWIDMRVHLAAMRKMEKIFLSHLWEQWRILEGLPVREPYAMEYLAHGSKYEASEFVKVA